MRKVLISNIGFGEASPKALALIDSRACVVENKDKRRFTEEDFIKNIDGVHILIAGTEKITRSILEQASDLKIILRVGSGIDNIDLAYAKEKKINICYTPDAPSAAVPEFTLALILNLIKGVSSCDRQMHANIWSRPMGRLIESMKVGIVGAGKIGSKVTHLIKSIAPSVEILFYDPHVLQLLNAKKCNLEELLAESDIISFHLSSSDSTKGFIGTEHLKRMKPGTYLVNTSRGDILDEEALYQCLKTKHLAGAALDVFEIEPYSGKLSELENCILTSHIASMSRETRALMEEQVAEDVVRFIDNRPLARVLDGFNFMDLI